MLRIIGYIIGIVVLAVAGILAVAAFQPDSFRIERSAVIDAPPEKIEAILTDFRRAKEWSPWEELDPNLQRTIGGAETGVGATYAWSGNNDVGAGRQEITAVEPGKLVRVNLEFERPMKTVNTVEYSLQPEGDGTKVTWAMFGPQPLIGRAFGLFMDIDAMVGKDFEKGLSNLKALAEQP